MAHEKQLGEITTPLNTVRTAGVEPQIDILFSNIPADVGTGFSRIRVQRDSSTNARVDRAGPDARLSCDASTDEFAHLQTDDRINYHPGQLALAGWQLTVPSDPVGDQDVWAGASNGDNGVGVGVKRFDRGEGTPGATSGGPQAYVFRRSGGTETIVPQEHWNIDSLDGSGDDDGNPSGHDIERFHDGNVVRLDPMLYYGDVEYRLVVVTKKANRTVYVPIHSFTVSGEPMTEQPNVPIAAEVSTGETAESIEAQVRAFHAHGVESPANTRRSGEHRRNQSVGGTITPLVSWRLREGWEHINTTPSGVTISTDQDIVIELLSDVSLDTQDFQLPDRHSPTETAVEFDTTATAFDDTGESQYITHLEGGQGRTALSDIDIGFTLPENTIICVAARAPGQTASVSTTARTQSDF